MFIWNADETRARPPKKQSVPAVIIAVRTDLGLITVPERRDHSQRTFLIAISAFSDSILPLFLPKNKTFEKNPFAEQHIDEEHDYIIKISPKTFLNEV
jgi:hypothetical protein